MSKEAKLIVLSGPPCSGKSTLAGELQRRTGFVHLELDRLRPRILPGPKQDEADRDTTYRAMHVIAEYLVLSGQSVIMDATYGRPLHRQGLRELAEVARAPLRIIQCRAPAELAVQRFNQRAPGHFAVDLTENLVRDLALRYPYGGDALILSSAEPIESCMTRIENYL